MRAVCLCVCVCDLHIMSMQESDEDDVYVYIEMPVMFSLNWGLSFQQAELKVKDTLSTVTLVARRCTRRLGTMFR